MYMPYQLANLCNRGGREIFEFSVGPILNVHAMGAEHLLANMSEGNQRE